MKVKRMKFVRNPKNAKWIGFVTLVVLVSMIISVHKVETQLKRNPTLESSQLNSITLETQHLLRSEVRHQLREKIKERLVRKKTGTGFSLSFSSDDDFDQLFKDFPALNFFNKSKMGMKNCPFCIGNNRQTNMPAEKFVAFYERQCNSRNRIAPKEGGFLCDCAPKSLTGRQRINISQLHNEPDRDNCTGGWWKPDECSARDKVAILIPFRDRQKHLDILMQYLRPLLQRQQIHYRIFVVEQATPKIFNKAALMNAGFLEAKELFDFDCIIFHDVDMIPEDDRNFYTCLNSPRHVAAYVNKWNYSVGYNELVGGALLFTPQQFQQVNGFSNTFYGWGGEDDDMFRRLQWQKLDIFRYPSRVALYTMLSHQRDAGNPGNKFRFGLAALEVPGYTYPEDGINSVRYFVRTVKQHCHYTWMYVDLPHPKNVFELMP